MRERPILFSGPMVRALLDGTKTQTRRVVTCPNKPWKGRVYDAANWTVEPHLGGGWRASQHDEDGKTVPEFSRAGFPCPYGVPGDRLWVRETWAYYGGDEYLYQQEPQCVQHRATDEYIYSLTGEPSGDRKWRPSIFMPRWASRITLEVTGVRVERLQEISRGDAMAEGCPFANMADGPYPRVWYEELWDSLNAARGYGWDANPWVWVVSFRRIEVTP